MIKKLCSWLRVKYIVWYTLGYKLENLHMNLLIKDKVVESFKETEYKSMAKLVSSSFDRAIFERKGFLHDDTAKVVFKREDDGEGVYISLSYAHPIGIRKFLPPPMYHRKDLIESLNNQIPKVSESIYNNLFNHFIPKVANE